MFSYVCDHSRKSLQVCRLITVENNNSCYPINEKMQTQNKKLILRYKIEFSCSVCSQNQWIVEKILKNNTNNYCFKGTSQMRTEVISPTR
ncbi:hypothetical protein VIGAN_01271900 [Vigna angularis var. angularis]|uniref:Uncharacterized protein n=1 Tax=Vigna angularis var. angularis TaxID=157739 RepID=A0A0S3R2M1_PHAAN|nr:hypothetical protein VIGAN_01271900 [Vigna angularis var. angularis]